MYLRIIRLDHFLIFVLIVHMRSQVSLFAISQIRNLLCILMAPDTDITQDDSEHQKNHCPGQRAVEQDHEQRIRLNAKLQCSSRPLFQIPVSGVITSQKQVQITDSMVESRHHADGHGHIVHCISDPKRLFLPILHCQK